MANINGVVEDWHRGDWMQTVTGHAFYPLSPNVNDIEIIDIAHGLSRQCRYNGHVKDFYSVAEHCVNLSWAVPAEYALWALLHDATEAYVGDVIRPVKRYLPDFETIEDGVMYVIAEKYGLTGGQHYQVSRGPNGSLFNGLRMPDIVKDADTRILLNERRDMLNEPPKEWSVSGEPLPNIHLVGWAPQEAYERYLDRFYYLTEGI